MLIPCYYAIRRKKGPRGGYIRLRLPSLPSDGGNKEKEGKGGEGASIRAKKKPPKPLNYLPTRLVTAAKRCWHCLNEKGRGGEGEEKRKKLAFRKNANQDIFSKEMGTQMMIFLLLKGKRGR